MSKLTRVTGKQIDFSRRGKTVISNKALITDLIQEQSNTLKSIAKEIAPVRVGEISIDEDGNLVISNADFKAQLKRLVAESPTRTGDTNYVLCGGNAYRCGT